MAEDVEMESTHNKLAAQRMLTRTERSLDAVGLNENTAKKLFNDESNTIRKRVLKITATTENSSDSNNSNLTKWTALKDNEGETTAAVIRARKSKARLDDLNDEMEQLAERQAAREKRIANLRAIMAENAEESEALQMKTARVTARAVKREITFE